MKKPEWEKESEMHRDIYISTASPTTNDGKDGDIWIVYK